jgi:hypothetical protein
MTMWLETGGARFIGPFLCNALPLRSDQDGVLHGLSTGRWDNLPRSAALIEAGISHSGAIIGTDGCFHLAANTCDASGGALPLHQRCMVAMRASPCSVTASRTVLPSSAEKWPTAGDVAALALP